MKKIVMAMCLLIAGVSAATVSAQNPSCPKKEKTEKSCCMKKSDDCRGKKDGRHLGKKEMQEKLFKGIELTPAQQAELRVLRDKQHKSTEKEMKKMKESRAKRMQDFDKGLAKILTPEQMATYNANKAQMKKVKDDRKDKEPKKFKRTGASVSTEPTVRENK